MSRPPELWRQFARRASRRRQSATGAASRGATQARFSPARVRSGRPPPRSLRWTAAARPPESPAGRRNLRPQTYLLAYCSTARSGYCSWCHVIKQDDELDKLEEDIRKLKNKYDQFFAGIQKLPPMHERRVLEVYIYELGKQKMRENARHFRYSQLLTRYNQLRELWGRKMREREAGPLDFRRRSAL